MKSFGVRFVQEVEILENKHIFFLWDSYIGSPL